MNKYDLLEYMKKNKRYLSEKEITTKMKSNQPSIHNKLKSLVKSRRLDVRKKTLHLGKFNPNRRVKHYRFKK